MRTPRLFVGELPPEHPFDDAVAFELRGERAHYLSRVLRRGVGDRVQLFDGLGRRIDGEIREVARDLTRVAGLTGTFCQEPEPSMPIEIALAMPKGDGLDDVLHAVTELGVQTIALLDSDRSEGKLPAEPARATRRLAHWHGVIVSACEQSGRDRLPVLRPPARFVDWLNAAADGWAGWLLQPGAPTPLQTRRADLHGPLRIAIGPEGGWSLDEQAMAQKAGLHAIALPTGVLRARSAPLATIAMVLALRSATVADAST